MSIKSRDLRTLRKEFDATYEINYPFEAPRAEAVATSNVVMIIWGIVSIAGAIISLPHTVGAVVKGVSNMPDILKLGYGLAVFVGVELALIMVAFTSAYRQLDNPKPRPVITIATILASVMYRLGLRHRPTPPTSEDGQSVGGLLVMLLVSALLFNLADTTKDTNLLTATKFVSGLIAPALLFLAGHEFAHHLAGKLLAGKVSARVQDEARLAWQRARDEAWRDYVASLGSAKEVQKTVPLASTHTQTSLLGAWGTDDHANMTAINTANGNFTGEKTGYLLNAKE